ncbi:hypothetical protein ACHWQZ_G001246 [Mnemiopsis leidyi]
MKMDHSFSPLVLSTTALSLTSIFYGLGVLIRSKKKLGIRAVLASIAFQILFWDFLRCLTIGVISGVYYMITPDMGHLCTFIGPLTDMSHRLPFFLVLGHVILGLKRSEENSALRWTGLGTVVVGYLISIGYAALPYIRGSTYQVGQEGFCTYYPDDVFDINYETVTMKQMLGYSVSLSVAPFAVMFVLLAAGSTVLLCAKSRDSTSLINAGALLFCYTPMMGVGMALTANYFGMATILTSWDPDHEQSQKLILFMSMVLVPVSTPLVKLLINFFISCCKSRSKHQKEKMTLQDSSNSTTILVHDVDGVNMS